MIISVCRNIPIDGSGLEVIEEQEGEGESEEEHGPQLPAVLRYHVGIDQVLIPFFYMEETNLADFPE